MDGSLEIEWCEGDILPQDPVDILCDQQSSSSQSEDQQGVTPQHEDQQNSSTQSDISNNEDVPCVANIALLNLCDELEDDDFEDVTMDLGASMKY